MALLKTLFAPGSLALLMMVLAVGALAIMQRGRLSRFGRIWTLAWLAAYGALSFPPASRALHHGLAAGYEALESAQARSADEAIVVLSGSAGRYRLGDGDVADVMTIQTALRVREAARVYRMMGSPLVFLSGAGPAGARAPEVVAMHEGLIDAGIPADRIVMESRSMDTRQSAVAMRQLLWEHGIARPVLVTSIQHMRRSARAFQKMGIDVVPAPAPVLPARGPAPWTYAVPHAGALALSELCLHEYVGILYYRLRGWA